MPIGGFEGPSGRRVPSVERALTASALLPTVAFAALGAVSVFLAVQMAISPLGPVGGLSVRDGGHGVTMPRMSVSIGPQRLQHSVPARDRETTTADAPSGPTTLDLARPVAHPIPPTRARETSTDVRPTGLAGLTPFTVARQVAHTIAPTLDRETTTSDAQSTAMTAAVNSVAVTNAPVTDLAVARTAVSIWEATTASVEPQVQAGEDATAAPEVMYSLLARTAIAPAPEPAPAPAPAPAPESDDRKPQTPQNEDPSVASVKTPHHTDPTQASEHAKTEKSGP